MKNLVDVTIVNVAIPTGRESRGATFGHIQWIAVGHALAAGLITGGRLGDIRGRERVLPTPVGLAGLLLGAFIVEPKEP
ncbi:hypothetical protein [Streptomyces sp. NPDC049906]|uniref:hypothetical protein n=1 Tax=Streptomyces sp. NPDC049906 TaxID=3155656 RepID=UPI00341741A6